MTQVGEALAADGGGIDARGAATDEALLLAGSSACDSSGCSKETVFEEVSLHSRFLALESEVELLKGALVQAGLPLPTPASSLAAGGIGPLAVESPAVSPKGATGARMVVAEEELKRIVEELVDQTCDDLRGEMERSRTDFSRLDREIASLVAHTGSLEMQVRDVVSSRRHSRDNGDVVEGAGRARGVTFADEASEVREEVTPQKPVKESAFSLAEVAAEAAVQAATNICSQLEGRLQAAHTQLTAQEHVALDLAESIRHCREGQDRLVDGHSALTCKLQILEGRFEDFMGMPDRVIAAHASVQRQSSVATARDELVATALPHDGAFFDLPGVSAQTLPSSGPQVGPQPTPPKQSAIMAQQALAPAGAAAAAGSSLPGQRGLATSSSQPVLETRRRSLTPGRIVGGGGPMSPQARQVSVAFYAPSSTVVRGGSMHATASPAKTGPVRTLVASPLSTVGWDRGRSPSPPIRTARATSPVCGSGGGPVMPAPATAAPPAGASVGANAAGAASGGGAVRSTNRLPGQTVHGLSPTNVNSKSVSLPVGSNALPPGSVSGCVRGAAASQNVAGSPHNVAHAPASMVFAAGLESPAQSLHDSEQSINIDTTLSRGRNSSTPCLHAVQNKVLLAADEVARPGRSQVQNAQVRTVQPSPSPQYAIPHPQSGHAPGVQRQSSQLMQPPSAAGAPPPQQGAGQRPEQVQQSARHSSVYPPGGKGLSSSQLSLRS